MKPEPRPRKTHLALALALCLAIGGLGSPCDPGAGPSLTVTLNAVPDAQNDVLVVPPGGFTIDIRYVDPQALVPSTLTLLLGGESIPALDLTDQIVASDAEGAVAVAPELGLAPGSYWVAAQADEVAGGTATALLTFAVRNPPPGGGPLGAPQWVQLDVLADPDGDGQPDLFDDLASFGLWPADPNLQAATTLWLLDELFTRAQAFYETPNPSGLPGGDAAPVTFSLAPAASGPYTRICVGGEDPTGGGTVGNLLFDPGNSNPGDVACDTFLPSGVFPREIHAYSGASVFQSSIAPIMAAPVGSDPLDTTVLGVGYDPGDPAQLARFQQIERAVQTLAQAIATVTAHELGHALGLVPRGAPGGGLFGGTAGSQDTHNVEPGGATPTDNWLMNEGPSFGFAELVGQAGHPLPRFRPLNWAYLRGRIVLDAKVTGIFPAPVLDYASPTTISLSGPPVVPYVCHGDNFLATPSIRLVGPLALQLSSETFVDATEVTALVSVLQLAPGTYDLELTNADGQVAVLPDAVDVVP